MDARWAVIGGDAEFFRITKRFHNRLHGADDGGQLGERERAVYERRCRAKAELLAPRSSATSCCCTIPRPRG